MQTDRRKGRTSLKTKAETGEMHAQAKEHQGLPVTTGSQKEAGKGSPLKPLKGAQPCWHLDYGLPVSGTVRESIPAVLNC